ncbi:cytochrome P450, partial [Sphaerisporangium sp. NPDC004334]
HRLLHPAPPPPLGGRSRARFSCPRTWSAPGPPAPHDPGVGRQLDRLPAELAGLHRRWDNDALAMVRRNVFNLDPPDHTRLRRLMAPGFGARPVAALVRTVHRVVGELVDAMAGMDTTNATNGMDATKATDATDATDGMDGMDGMGASAAAGGEVDVVRALALPLPILVVADLLGFPAEDRALFRRWSDEMLAGRDGAETRRSGMKFVAHITERIRERRSREGDDLLSHLLRAEDGGQITRLELISSVFQLLFAGDETTVNLIGIGVLELLRHPEQLALLRARPELIDSAVEEVLRYNGPVGHSRPLYAMTDVDFGGTVIARGDIIVPVLLAANRDPAVFPRPDVFAIDRSPNRHLGFGHGIHFCLGAALARVQARAAIGTLVRRFPRMALAVDPGELEWTRELFLRGVRRLPLRLHG